MKRTISEDGKDTAKVVAANSGMVVAGAGLAALMVVGGFAVTQAAAEPRDSSIAASCALGSNKVAVKVPQNVDDKVDPVQAGASETLVTKTGLPQLPVEVTVNKMVVTTPIPDQIASVDAVTFSGGNMKATYSVQGRNLVVTFTGPVSSKDIQVPVVVAQQTVRSDAGGSTIAWRTFSQVVADTNYGTATCTPNDPAQVVNTTSVTSGSSGSTSTTQPSSGTTAPPTTADPTPTSAPPTSRKPGVQGKGSATASAGGSTATAGGGVQVDGPSGSPGAPSLPAAPGLPSAPVPSLPGAPGLPTAPTLPGLPTVPTLPGSPSLPGVPTLPSSPPAVPVPVPAPTLPSVPSLPPTPAPGGSLGTTVTVTGSVHAF